VDILNPHEWPASWACVFVKLYKRVPVVWMCNDVWHLPDEGEETRLRFKVMKKTVIGATDFILSLFIDRIVVLDNRIKGIVKNYYHKEAIVIRSGIDLEDYKKEISQASAREQLKIEKNSFVFICFSIFFPHRRFEDVIEAFRRLYNENSNARLMIIGSSQFDQDYYLKIKKLRESYNLQMAIDINDSFLPEDQVKKYLIAADVFVFPNEKQTWGLAVIEAMALGKPCIVSDEVGVHEIINNGENGLIFKCRNIDDLSEKMERLFKDEKLRKKIGLNAQKFVFANFSWENYAGQMMDVFQKVAK
jgi:glycosyltransferase involved in cell wall biosynthesis